MRCGPDEGTARLLQNAGAGPCRPRGRSLLGGAGHFRQLRQRCGLFLRLHAEMCLLSELRHFAGEFRQAADLRRAARRVRAADRRAYRTSSWSRRRIFSPTFFRRWSRSFPCPSSTTAAAMSPWRRCGSWKGRSMSIFRTLNTATTRLRRSCPPRRTILKRPPPRSWKCTGR